MYLENVVVTLAPVQFKKLRPDAIIPTRGSEKAAGLDLYAADDVVLLPGSRALVSTGVAVALPPNTEGQVRPRSGLAAKHGITVLNTPGTVDEDYRGEVKVILYNSSSEGYQIKKGDRIAQLVIASVLYSPVQEVDTLDDTARGVGGFGSSGK